MKTFPLFLLIAAIITAFALSSCVSVEEEPATTTRTTTTVDTPLTPAASVSRTTTTY